MTDYEAYEKYCRSPLTIEQIARIHGIPRERMHNIIWYFGRFSSKRGDAPDDKKLEELLCRDQIQPTQEEIAEQTEYVKQAFEQTGIDKQAMGKDVIKLAVDLIQNQGIPVSTVAKVIGCTSERVRSWSRRAK